MRLLAEAGKNYALFDQADIRLGCTTYTGKYQLHGVLLARKHTDGKYDGAYEIEAFIVSTAGGHDQMRDIAYALLEGAWKAAQEATEPGSGFVARVQYTRWPEATHLPLYARLLVGVGLYPVAMKLAGKKKRRQGAPSDVWPSLLLVGNSLTK